MSTSHRAPVTRRRGRLVAIIALVASVATAAVVLNATSAEEGRVAFPSSSPSAFAPPSPSPTGAARDSCEFGAYAPTLDELAGCELESCTTTALSLELRIEGRGAVDVPAGFGLYMTRSPRVAWGVTPSGHVASVPLDTPAPECLEVGSEPDAPETLRPVPLCSDLVGEAEDGGVLVGVIVARCDDDPQVMVVDVDHRAAGRPVLVVTHLQGGVWIGGSQRNVSLRDVSLRVTPQAYEDATRLPGVRESQETEG